MRAGRWPVTLVGRTDGGPVGRRGGELAGGPVEFDAGPAWIPRTRHWVVDQARAAGADPHALRLVALLTTELVTNAVRHGPHGGPVRVAVRTSGGVVRVEVRDASAALPVVKHVAPSAPGGRGVMLVDRLASRWGVRPHADAGKTVWFELPLEA